MIAFIKDLVAHGMKTRLVSIGRKTEIAGFRIWEESRMAEYIEREAVEKFIENGLNNPDKKKAFGHDAIEIMAEVHYMPAADVSPVVHAQWIYRGEEKGYQCSACQSFCLLNYESDWCKSKCCPHCGAKMDG